MTDREWVRDALKRWGATLDYASAPERDAGDGAVALALWATLNVDRLLRIADDRTSTSPVPHD